MAACPCGDTQPSPRCLFIYTRALMEQSLHHPHPPGTWRKRSSLWERSVGPAGAWRLTLQTSPTC